jgi:hypothetical protein
MGGQPQFSFDREHVAIARIDVHFLAADFGDARARTLDVTACANQSPTV